MVRVNFRQVGGLRARYRSATLTSLIVVPVTAVSKVPGVEVSPCSQAAISVLRSVASTQITQSERYRPVPRVRENGTSACVTGRVPIRNFLTRQTQYGRLRWHIQLLLAGTAAAGSVVAQ